VSYVGMLLNTNRLNYSSAFTSSLATLDPALTVALAEGFYIATAQSNGTTT
jgi:hypothetical protein